MCIRDSIYGTRISFHRREHICQRHSLHLHLVTVYIKIELRNLRLQRRREVQRKRTEAEAIKENLEAQIVIIDKKKDELDKFCLLYTSRCV